MFVLRIAAAACILGVSLAGCDNAGEPAPVAAPVPAAPVAPQATPSAFVAVASGTEIPGPVFEAALAATRGGGHCPMSDFDSAIVSAAGDVKRGARFLAIGWASDQHDRVPDVITLVLRGEKAFGFPTTRARMERKDVVAATGIADLLHSGYAVDLDLSQVPVGAYLVGVMQKSGDEQFLCDSGRRLKVIE